MVNNTDEARRRSVQDPPANLETSPMESLIFSLATVADSIPAWGGSSAQVRLRDIELRRFWPTEPILASAIYSMVIRNGAFSWKLIGPEQTVKITQDMFHTSDLGRGWKSLVIRNSTDLFTQDNGAFMETIRIADDAESPVINLAHLDAGRCTRTGDPETPVLYADRKGRVHELKWYQVATIEEFPSPVETMNGVQLCAVSRVLRAAQLLRDVGIYQREKIGGSNPNAIYMVSGVGRQEISDAMEQHKNRQDIRGMARWIVPLVVTAIDPNANVSLETIDLKSLPDGFDIEAVMKWYINQLALGFGADYQDFAPLPGGGLGSSTQSLVLHEKSRGKGPAAYMQTMEYIFNFKGVIPQNVTFEFDEQDIMADTEQATLFATRSAAIKELVESNVIDPQAGRQMLLDEGLLSQESFDRLSENEDLTTDVVVEGETPAQNKARRGTRKKKQPKKRKRAGYGDKEEAVAAFGEDIRLEAEEDYEGEILAALQATFEDLRARMGINSKRRWLARKQGPEDILIDGEFWGDFRLRMLGVAIPFAQKTALDAATFNLDAGLSVNMDLVNERVLQFSRTYSNAWWEQIEQTTRKQLGEAITTWQETGLGTRGFPDLVKSLEKTFGRQRAQLVATNEVTVIFDKGNNLSHIAAGIKEEEWQTAEDEFVESICARLDGQRFAVDEGPRPVSGTHIGCRCARLPVAVSGRVIEG